MRQINILLLTRSKSPLKAIRVLSIDVNISAISSIIKMECVVKIIEIFGIVEKVTIQNQIFTVIFHHFAKLFYIVNFSMRARMIFKIHISARFTSSHI